MTLRVIFTRIRVIWESISTSYWFIPVVMMTASLALCYLCLALIERAFLPDLLRPMLPMVTASGVEQLLSTVASAMITVTSIAFSMTLVSLTLASNQFGPRLIRNFMHDKSTQFVLGILISTFSFCLISLHHLSSITNNQDAVSVLAGVTVFFALLDCVTIIFFIHHVSRSIQADEVINDCVRQFEQNIDALLPVPESNSAFKAVTEQWATPGDTFAVTFTAQTSGYVQTINYASFLNQPPETIAGCELAVRSGDHVLTNEVLFTLYCHQPTKPEDFNTLSQAIVLGNNRTPIQDPEFAISQLVEIALRAMSPGINDPNTAITCIDKLTALCMRISSREFPAECLVHQHTEIWLKRRTFTYSGIIDRAYNQIRQVADDHVAVLIQLLRNLHKLQQHSSVSASHTIALQVKSIEEHIATLKLSDKDQQDLQTVLVDLRRGPD